MSLRLASLVVLAMASHAVAWTHTVTAPTVDEYFCANLLLGRRTADTIVLKQTLVGSHEYLYIADYCSEQSKKLVGEDVAACDTGGPYPPSVAPVGAGFSPLRVDCPPQNEPCAEGIHVNVTLYCEPADHLINLNTL